jgi:RND family efflux transporter MFP subunit
MSALDDLRIDRGGENEPPPRRRRWLVLAVATLAAAGAFWAWVSAGVPVVTAPVRQTEAGGPRVALNASGYVTARRAATVSAKTTARVVEVMLEEGLRVEQDQVLARLDDTNVRTNLRLAEARGAAAQAALQETRVWRENADQELRRLRELAANHIATASELDRALAEFNAREAQLAKQTTEVEVAVREVSVWQQQLEDMVIRAPFAGIVTMKNAQPGEMISPISAGGGFTRTGIATIVDMTSLEIEVDVNESYLNRVRTAQPVEATLDAYPDWRIAAKVIAIIPTADRQKSTVKVRVGFEQLDPRILPDMAVKVAFRDTDTAGTAPALAVPKAAVQRVEGRDVVFVVQAGRAVLRPVKLGTPGPDEAVILSGLAAGERVITGGSGRLRDGLRVREPRP